VSVLSAEQATEIHAALDRDGYIVLRGVVDPERIDEFRTALVAEYDRSEKFTGGGSFSGHLNCFPGEHARFFLEAITRHGIVEAVQAMRPNRSNAVRATLNFNLPGSVAQHYHMDGLYIEDFVICNVAVVDTDLVNGAIDLLPGTQREFTPYWKYALRRGWKGSTRIPMQRGDVLLRRSTVWHRGMPNRSEVPRPMMSLTFGENSAPDGDPFAVHDGAMHFYPNWFNTSRLGRLREKAFVAAPWTYSSFRFVKSLRGKRGHSSY
jgi:ectoine hydroxylase-related dioxygenase (phytanoyl-CoA dioxygenase family)